MYILYIYIFVEIINNFHNLSNNTKVLLLEHNVNPCIISKTPNSIHILHYDYIYTGCVPPIHIQNGHNSATEDDI